VTAPAAPPAPATEAERDAETSQAAAAQPTAGEQPIVAKALGGEQQGEEQQADASEGAAEPEQQRVAEPTAAMAMAGTTRLAPNASAVGGSEAQERAATDVSGPATVAARAAGSAVRSPTPPAPAGIAAVGAASVGAAAAGASAGGATAAGPARVARPAAPQRPATGSGRGDGGRPGDMASRARATGDPRARSPRVQGPPFLQEERRSAGRTTALIVGGVVFGVAVLVGILLSLGGGSSHPSSATTASQGKAGRHHRTHHARTSGAAASPAETAVVVLNATGTTGLAHRISGNLQQSGYTQAAALSAQPAARSTSVVEYSEGHRTEAEHVGQTLGIGEVAPLESAVAGQVGAATVVVIAGADQAALGGGEG
jgi:hypothetical protein